MRQVLLQLQLVSRRTVNQSLPMVQKSDEVYFANMGFLLSSSWRPKVQYELLTAERNTGNWNSEGAVDEAKLKEEFTESRSDQCLLDVHRNKDRCRFDSSCLRLMLHGDGARGYHLTHQILYATFIEASGCAPPSLGLRRRLAQLCGRALLEHRQLLLYLLAPWRASRLTGRRSSKVRRRSRPLMFDLALEQVFACGRIGFLDFVLDSRLLAALLTAQHPRLGCFGRQSLPTPPSRRPLAVGSVAGGVCELHLTGVAASAASAYLLMSLQGRRVLAERLQRSPASIRASGAHPSLALLLPPVLLLLLLLLARGRKKRCCRHCRFIFRKI
ncbi:hypothetical protein BOX15_Mlig026210g1 [Macrostomum lignano]|uniref:Uncharacterized protein n=1 Tax=Macrostomum lignano TaxID=282301 RepID=A0A267DN88_9PLAT|nr:hypothetical protein BOX15_Mlig026210g1 [Macrostomum lignano]